MALLKQCSVLNLQTKESAAWRPGAPCVPSKSVRGVPSPCCNGGLASARHGSDEVSDCLLRDGLPLFLQGPEQLVRSRWGVGSCSQASVQFVPYVLNGVQIWRQRWPGQGVDVVGGEDSCGEACCVGPGVVLLEHDPGSGHERQDVWLHNVLHVLLSRQAALHTYQLTPASVVDGPPHHDAATTMRRCLVHTVLLVALVGPAVDSPPSVMALEQELGLVREPDVSPVVPRCPVSVLSGPLQSGLAMTPGQHIATNGPVSPQARCMQSIPDGLV